MLDVKEVVNGLEMSYKYSNVDENNTLVPQWIVLHALALLKAQEPVEPKYDPDDDDWAHCGHCGARLYERWVGANYCAFCGRAVKWE